MSTTDRDDQGAAPVREDGATFAVTRVRSGRRPRFLAIGAVLAIGGLIGMGLVDGASGPAAPSAPDVAHNVGPTAAPLPTAIGHGREDPGQRFSNRPPPVGPTTPVAAIMELDLRPAGNHLFVHGDVYSLDVVRVEVSVEDSAGNVGALKSVKLQTGSTARLGANSRFDARFDVPDELMGDGLWVHANAYDVSGRLLVALEEPIIAPVM